MAEVCRRLSCAVFCLGMLFLFGWMMDAIVGAIYFDAWYPKIAVHDVQIKSFTLSSNSSTSQTVLNGQLAVVVHARKFSRHPRKETLLFEVATSYRNSFLGRYRTPRFRRQGAYNDTMELVMPLQINQYVLDSYPGSLLRGELGNNILVLALEVMVEIESPLYFKVNKYDRQVCEVILKPPSASQPAKMVSLVCGPIPVCPHSSDRG